MFQHKTLLAIGVFTVATTASVLANRAANSSPSREFDELSVIIEVNETDEDFAVVIAMEVAEAFLELVIQDPFENVALHVQASGPQGMPLNEFVVQAERYDVQAGLAEFPAGWYRFTALGVDGSTFTGLAELSLCCHVRRRTLRSATHQIHQVRSKPLGDTDDAIHRLAGLRSLSHSRVDQRFERWASCDSRISGFWIRGNTRSTTTEFFGDVAR